jgi:predicted transcriptional regulator
MKHTIIAPLGEHLDALFVGIREFPTEKIYFLVPKGVEDKVSEAKREVFKFKIPVAFVPLENEVYEDLFRKIGQIKASSESGNVLINVSTADRNLQCAVTSAAFVNGIKAFRVQGDAVVTLPILKFSYYRLLTDRKIKLLKTLAEDSSCCKSLDELGKRAGMSLPLVSYHIHGSRKSEGLEEMGLVNLEEAGGRVAVSLSLLGRLLINGYVQPPEEKG